MGYYARGSGHISFLKEPDTATLDKVLEEIGSVFDECYPGGDIQSESGMYIDFWVDSKYYEERVTGLLSYLTETLELTDGCVEFAGEDDTYWRYLYVKEKNDFVEQEGRIVYYHDG